MGKILRKLLCCLMLAALVGSMIPNAHAQDTFNSYTYDEWDESQKVCKKYEEERSQKKRSILSVMFFSH